MPNRDMIVWPTKMSDFHRQSEFETIVNAVYLLFFHSVQLWSNHSLKLPRMKKLALHQFYF
jgi:hypothetical protein